jgi:hypothetical protein
VSLVDRLNLSLWHQRMAMFAEPGPFDGRCPCCGGPAVLVERGHSVYLRAPGVEVPDESKHPANEGWSP